MERKIPVSFIFNGILYSIFYLYFAQMCFDAWKSVWCGLNNDTSWIIYIFFSRIFAAHILWWDWKRTYLANLCFLFKRNSMISCRSCIIAYSYALYGLFVHFSFYYPLAFCISFLPSFSLFLSLFHSLYFPLPVTLPLFSPPLPTFVVLYVLWKCACNDNRMCQTWCIWLKITILFHIWGTFSILQ